MKHKHYDKIVAKAANMDLVVFCRDAYHVKEGWFETYNLPIQEEFDYFLCLPQHKESCLAWLNGANGTLTEQLAEVKAQSLKEGFLLGYKQCSVDIDQGQWTDDDDCLNEYVDDIIYLHCRREVL